MVDFKLANILIKPDDFTEDYRDIFFRNAEGASYSHDSESLVFSGKVDFFTYFNALSWGKWKRYASLDNAWLHLEIKGDRTRICQVAATTSDKCCNPVTELTEHPGTESFTEFELQLSCSDDFALISFVLESSGITSIRNAYYYTKIAESRILPVELALATTTFQKEEYILHNIDAIKREILDSTEPIAQHFKMFVVDNGRTLDNTAVNDSRITIIPNANVGGAGGFARGMIAAIDARASHVLLMDDDVRVMPESFIRTFNLLSLRNKRYHDAFLNGAMLSLEQPNLQFEDVAYVREDAAYARIKHDLLIDSSSDIVENEMINVEVKNAYGAWWYSCIPISAIQEHGFPLPVFVRCDDVEYGMRCKPTYMCMNGICVWHASFEGRYRASIDGYQYTRNFLIMMSVDDKCSDRLFLTRMHRTLMTHLRALDYRSADLVLDGFEDYLKGPDFLINANGEKILMSNSAENEKMTPLDNLDPSMLSMINLENGRPQKNRGILSKLAETLPYDRHYLPRPLLINAPAAIYYRQGAFIGSHSARRSALVAIDHDQTHGAVRHMDKQRWRSIKIRYKKLKRHYMQHRDEIRKAYKDALPYLSSRTFWEQYLEERVSFSQ